MIADLDLVLVMSVNPGFGGQSNFCRDRQGPADPRRCSTGAARRAALEVDGGITVDTIAAAWRAGADTFVAGTAVFRTDDLAAAVRALKAACRPGTRV